MIRLNNCWRLTRGLTILISLILVTLVILDRWLEYKYTLVPQEKSRQLQRLNESSARMWQTISDLMLADNRAATEGFITSYSASTPFRAIALIDEGRVLLANQLSLKGSKVGDISCYRRTWVSEAVTESSPVIVAHPSRENHLCSVMPVTMLERSTSLRPERLAALVVEYDMSPAMTALTQQVWNPQQWVRLLAFALLVAFVITLILNHFIVKPLNLIRLRMQEYGQGNALARVELEGSCELMEVAENFNELMTQVSEAEQEVRRSEERWIKALDAAGDGVWDWDLRTNTLFFSSQWKRMLGYQSYEIGDTFEDWSGRVHPDDLDKALRCVEAHLAGDTEVYRATYRMRCKNGDYRWFMDRGMVFERDSDGKALRVTGTHSDISEQKRTEAALKESQQQFQLAMQGSNDGLWDWRLRDNSIYFSPRWKGMLGYADDELENKLSVWEGLLHPDDLLAAREEAARCVTGKKDQYEVEFRLRHKQGHWVYALSRAIALKDENGHVERLVGTHMDLTEIRAVQKQLEESRHQLKKLAFYDALTGLPNRRLLEENMTRQLADSQANHKILAVAMMDLDGFKQVNDTHGHDIGDELLQAVADRLKLCMQEHDDIARLGGGR
ncbi:sensor domain-containing diguanylate cyclase [Oceanospirillum linum]|uniref:Sensor domain-containing diguanylate cyclase n=1 Tax=Oceanospirillum linum TaxID=966 RepID=A0A1T1HG01_OCELI|nr:PAS domain-containing protein [Oceanospirillum linum]OOV88732.1 hypothetical protein BTA35_0204435 [Oceanospirillum linum]SEG01387.1 PAS domain S-box-containing protein/diguanylate cyclase (GGDEF) domain-containing protein [Oleiphilus messinensis]SMP21803.1 PAS domain S-box-containing protein/diguanylate cyclase (GGDEF) domain-containing protein [Oceanospirillum linum]